ncbi:hypothetical protein NCCP436_09920 [Pseudomonas sp. NCCP-436]|nr:hypothetical protein NCCP436_09920 [Pseudomonas sp. NCCP-436]
MGDGWYAKRRDDLYERLLRRLAQALEQVDSIGHLQSGSAQELELVGLTTAELELIHAYLRGDLQRLPRLQP